MNIIWTLKAIRSYYIVSDYLQQKWGNKALINFANDVERVIKDISYHPYMFEASGKYGNIRKGYITQHNTLFYKVKPQKKVIEILLFWDNRQDSLRRTF